MVNVGRVCNNNQEEGVLSTDAHMGFIKTTGLIICCLRAFEVVHLLNFKNACIEIKVKALACVLIVAKRDGYM